MSNFIDFSWIVVAQEQKRERNKYVAGLFFAPGFGVWLPRFAKTASKVAKIGRN